MSSNNRTCCCTKKNKAEVVESLSRIGKSYENNYGLWANESLYGVAGTYTTGHYFKDNQNLCFGPVITDQMVNGADARTADETPVGGLSYESNITSLNFRNDSKSGTVNFANCEDCLRYHLTHVNTLDGDTSSHTDSDGVQFTGSYGRLYAVLVQCDCNDYFQFNQNDDAASDGSGGGVSGAAAFQRFAWPTCRIEETAPDNSPYAVTKDFCPTGRTKKDQENFDHKQYNESSTTVQDGVPDDMGHTYFYVDYTPMLEEVRDSTHPNFLPQNQGQTGVTYNTPNHTLANPGDSSTRSIPNSTLKTAGKITFASDTTSKTNLTQRFTGSESRIPINFCSGEQRASTYFKFDSSAYNSINNGTIQLIAGGVTKTYTIINTGSPSGTEFLATGSASQTAINFKTVVEGSNGHGLDKLMVELHGEEVYITQTTPGEAGNTTVTTGSSFDSTTSKNVTNFTGGTDKSDNMTTAGDNKGTFVVMKIDPALNETYDTNRAVYRAFKVVGFSQYKPSIRADHSNEADSIKEIPLGHIDEIHFRMNPIDSSVYYGAESAIAEANSSFCFNQAASNSNTAQLGTGTILSGLNTGAASGGNKWQGGNPCTRSSDNAADSQGAEMTVRDYGDFCKNSEYLPEFITVVREFKLDDEENPWANAAVSDKRFEACLEAENVYSNYNETEDKISNTDLTNGISGPPWGRARDHGFDAEDDNETHLRLVFKYRRNAQTTCNLVSAQPLPFTTVDPTKEYAFECPKENNGVGTRGSIDPDDVENYMCHYFLHSISDNQGGIVHWSTDPAIYLEDTQESIGGAGVLLDRRYLVDSNEALASAPDGTGDIFNTGDSTIQKLFINSLMKDSGGPKYTVEECRRQNNSKTSACMITPRLNSVNNPYIPSACLNENGSYYSYGGYFFGLGGSYALGSNPVDLCDDLPGVKSGTRNLTGDYKQASFGGMSFCELSDANDDANTTVITQNPEGVYCDQAEANGASQRPSIKDPIDAGGKFYGRTAYTGLGIPSYAPDHYNSQSDFKGIIRDSFDIYPSDGKYNYNKVADNGGRGKNAGGHTFMPTFTIGLAHTCLDTKKDKLVKKTDIVANYDLLPGERDEINGENFKRFRYECSTYVIPAGLYVFRIEEADMCSDDSGAGNLNTDSANNRCVFGLSMPIPSSVHDAHFANTNNRIHPRYLQWWEGFYRSYAQPGKKTFATTFENGGGEGRKPPAALGDKTSIFHGAMQWRDCRDGSDLQSESFHGATLSNIGACAAAKLNNIIENLDRSGKTINKICTQDQQDEPCLCGEFNCSPGGGQCVEGQGNLGEGFDFCCSTGGGECADDPDFAFGGFSDLRLTFNGNGQISGTKNVSPPEEISCKEAVAIFFVEDGDTVMAQEAWESEDFIEDGFGNESPFLCCLCFDEGDDTSEDWLSCTDPNGRGFDDPSGGGAGCVSVNQCCGNLAGCSIGARYWGPEIYPTTSVAETLDRWEIRSGVCPPTVASTFTQGLSGITSQEAWEQIPRLNGVAQPIGGSGFKGNDKETTRIGRLFFPSQHDSQDSNLSFNCDMRFIKNPNPYLYTQLMYDPDNGLGSGTAGECAFCQSVTEAPSGNRTVDLTKLYTQTFFGKKEQLTGPNAPQTHNFSTTHGLIHVSSLVDMGCSDRDYTSKGNGELVWRGSFSQIDFKEIKDNPSLSIQGP